MVIFAIIYDVQLNYRFASLFQGMLNALAFNLNASANAAHSFWQMCTDIFMGRLKAEMTLKKMEMMHFYQLNLPLNNFRSKFINSIHFKPTPGLQR